MKRVLPLNLGTTAGGDPILRSLAELPHLLIAGTGPGKSALIKSCIARLAEGMSPRELQLVLVETKGGELSSFAGFPHLPVPIVTDAHRAVVILERLVEEKEVRYQKLSHVGAANIVAYNKKHDPMTYVVAVVNELAELMSAARKDVEMSVVRLAQGTRAVGIHLILATRRPSPDVITGLIRTNMPSRIAFRVSRASESLVMLDRKGAERLAGKDEMLMKLIDATEPVRANGAEVSDKEIHRLAASLSWKGKPNFDPAWTEERVEVEDELLQDAVKLVREEGLGSSALLQRAFSIGYSRAARLVDVMVKRGILGQYQGSSERRLLPLRHRGGGRK